MLQLSDVCAHVACILTVSPVRRELQAAGKPLGVIELDLKVIRHCNPAAATIRT